MGKKSFIAACGLVVVLLVAVGGMVVYDSGRDDLIAPGVRVAGVDVGGLRVAVARERLQDALFAPLREPVTVVHRDRTFELTARQARLSVDIERSVAAAVERSRQGSILSRTLRALSDERVHADLPVQIDYDRTAVSRLVRRVERVVERDPVEATVDFAGGTVTRKPSRNGVAVQTARLRRAIARRLTSLEGSRMARVPTRTVRPRVTTEQLADRYPAVVIVDRSSFRLVFYKRLQVAKTYRIAVGKAGLETPAGLYRIQNKAENPSWHVPDSEWAGELRGKVIPPDDPRNPIEARWMGIYNGAGIHGTEAVSSLGTRASHGCIRMAIPDVIELYDQVPVQSPVYIL